MNILKIPDWIEITFSAKINSLRLTEREEILVLFAGTAKLEMTCLQNWHSQPLVFQTANSKQRSSYRKAAPYWFHSGPLPMASDILQILEILFWASLQTSKMWSRSKCLPFLRPINLKNCSQEKRKKSPTILFQKGREKVGEGNEKTIEDFCRSHPW